MYAVALIVMAALCGVGFWFQGSALWAFMIGLNLGSAALIFLLEIAKAAERRGRW